MTTVPYEHDEQAFLITRAYYQRNIYPELQLMFAIPNGGLRNKGVAKKLKKEGVKSGVPDLMLPVARGGYHGLFIEMKRIKKSSTDDNQKLWHKNLTEQGYKVVVCKGEQQAWKDLIEYLNL